MKRRQFIKTSAMAATAAIAAPYILPGGRLFAATGARKANHVVFCLFAGGVRNLESMQKMEGNLMPYTLTGSEPLSSKIIGGMSPLPAPSGTRLQQLGTLFKEFRYKIGPTGHFNGHTTAITGNYTDNEIQLRQPPKFPTVFEYYRKHHSPAASALNAWWISDSLGPYPFLNYSNYEGYGAAYGANMLQPSTFFNPGYFATIKSPVTFLDDDNDRAAGIRSFLNGQFRAPGMTTGVGVVNTEEDRQKIASFLIQTGNTATYDPFGVGAATNGDMLNIAAAIKVLQEFKPELLVVNMQNIDVCHTNYTEYCNNIRKADFALSKLWNAIQSIPGMANDTVLIVAPEHGRNLQPNTIVDRFGNYAIDHTNDEMSRQLFCLIVGPPNVIKQNQVISTITGESIDIVPTIAHILGFDTDIPAGMLPGRILNEAFV
jgi:hypothetical protein